MNAKMFSTEYCFECNLDFFRETKGTSVVLIRNKFDSAPLRNCTGNPEKYLDSSKILKDSRSTKAGLVLLDDGKEVFIKKYNNKGFRYAFKYMFRRAKPFRTWQNAWFYELLGIPSPTPMASMAERKAGILVSAYIIQESVSDVIPTLEFCRIMLDNQAIMKHFSESISTIFAKMHANGIYHGDTKMSNIFVRESGKKVYSFGFWDLDGSSFKKKPVCESMRTSELARTLSSIIEIAGRLGRKIDSKTIIENFTSGYEKCSGISIDRNNLEKKIKKHLKVAY